MVEKRFHILSAENWYNKEEFQTVVDGCLHIFDWHCHPKRLPSSLPMPFISSFLVFTPPPRYFTHPMLLFHCLTSPDCCTAAVRVWFFSISSSADDKHRACAICALRRTLSYASTATATAAGAGALSVQIDAKLYTDSTHTIQSTYTLHQY